MQESVYTPHSLQELIDKFHKEVDFFKNYLPCVLKNIFRRCMSCTEGRGQHFETRMK